MPSPDQQQSGDGQEHEHRIREQPLIDPLKQPPADHGARQYRRQQVQIEREARAHHVEHWADGRATKLSNLVSLCRRHHRLVHEGGIRVEARAGGGWRFRRADGRDFEVVRPEPAPDHHWTRFQETHSSLGIRIDANTAATRWTGEPLGAWQQMMVRSAAAGHHPTHAAKNCLPPAAVE